MGLPSHFSLQSLIRPNIASLKPYRCARDDYDRGILLDANENSLGSALAPTQLASQDQLPPSSSNPLQLSISTLSELAQLNLQSLSLHRYPSPFQIPIKENLARYRNSCHSDFPPLLPSNIFLGVGSDEILDLLFRITCKPGDLEQSGDRVVITPPTYGMYTVCANVNDVGIIKIPLNVDHGAFTVDLDSLEQVLSQPTSRPIKMIILCSPGNPTGTTISLQTITAILSNPAFKGLLVVDEAYIDFADPSKSALQLVRQGWQNLIVVQTLSKAFGLAGIRLGIAYGSLDLIQVLNNTKAPYSISVPTAVLGHAATTPPLLTKAESHIRQIQDNRDWLKTQLVQIPGMGKILGTSEANFVLIQVTSNPKDGSGEAQADSERAKKVYKHMAELEESEAIVVRYRGDDHGCLGCLRITVGTREECEKVIERLKQTLEIIQ